MQPEYPHPQHCDNGNAAQDRATAALLTGGGIDGVSAFFLRHWRPGADPPEPVFVIWSLNIGRFCLTVKYGRHSLEGGQWRVDTGSGPRATSSPLEQARAEALSIREILQERLNRPITVAPALALFDTDPDRSIERLSHRNRVPLLWDLEGCTGKLADPAIGGRLRQSLERRQALAEISALMEGIDTVGAVPSQKPRLPGLPVRIGPVGCTHRHDRSGPVAADNRQPWRTLADVPYWTSPGRRTTRSGFSWT